MRERPWCRIRATGWCERQSRPTLPVTAIPGPNAAVTALILSGLPPLPFMFLGFPPPKQAARRAAFSGLRAAERAGLSATLVWHEAPHRLLETLADLLRRVWGSQLPRWRGS